MRRGRIRLRRIMAGLLAAVLTTASMSQGSIYAYAAEQPEGIVETAQSFAENEAPEENCQKSDKKVTDEQEANTRDVDSEAARAEQETVTQDGAQGTDKPTEPDENQNPDESAGQDGGQGTDEPEDQDGNQNPDKPTEADETGEAAEPAGSTEADAPWSDAQEQDAGQTGGTNPQEKEVTVKLTGVYQFGDAPSKQEPEDEALSALAVLADTPAIEEYLYEQIKERNPEIDIRAYGIIERSEIENIFSGVLNEHPDLYFVRNNLITWSNGVCVTRISPSYFDLSTYNDEAFQKAVKEALAVVEPEMGDLEKAVALHDYLAVNCEYDYDRYLVGGQPDESYTAYGALVCHAAVCQGYALAYKYLLDEAGIEDCRMVTSDTMNHAWNLVKLNGEYYQVDVTWDDPTRDRIGRACHQYMFRSDEAFVEECDHHDWSVTVGAAVVDYEATDTRYDNAFWLDSDAPLVLSGDDCYYIIYDQNKETTVINKTVLSNITENGTTICEIGRWPVWKNSNSIWPAAYSGLFCVDGRIYYNDKSAIYSFAPEDAESVAAPRREFQADTTNGYIYGSAFCQGKVMYALHQSPDFSEKETVLTADIAGMEWSDDDSEGTEIPVDLDAEPAVSDNWGWQDYADRGNTVKSYLYENPSGTLTRVEYIDGKIVAEDYDESFTMTASRTIPMELSIWGGFYAGSQYNFVIFGQENPSEDNQTEVVRVVKYSKNWKRLGEAKLYGANTTVPFGGGSLRCAEYGGYLYIRTCHRMYRSSDGLNHQANMTLVVRQNDMAITDSYYQVANSSVGYVSHSFNQFVLVDQEQNLVTLDHGDAYPRSLILMRPKDAKAGGDKFSGSFESSELVSFPGETGDNVTGASAGGLAETANGYVTAFNNDGIGGGGTRALYLGYTEKDGFASKTVKVMDGGMATPVLAPTGHDGGYLLWTDAAGKFYDTRYADGGTVGEIGTADAALSDCQPILHNGELVWYVTAVRTAPVFYRLDVSTGRIHATPVKTEESASRGRIDASKGKTSYECGEILNTDDLVVHYTYNGKSKLVYYYTTNAAEIDMSVPGRKTLIISYAGLTDTMELIVGERGLDVWKTKTTYACGEVLNTDDLWVYYGIYYDGYGSGNQVYDYTTNAAEIDMSVPGKKTLIISYMDLTYTMELTVIDPANPNPGDQTEEDPGEGPGENPGDEPGENPGDEPGGNPGDQTEDTSDGRPQINSVMFPKNKTEYSAVYTGEQIRPVMVVAYQYQDAKGKTKTQKLKLNVDYTVSYSRNVNAGSNTAKVTVRGIGEYSGTITRDFTITPKSIKNVTLSAVGDIVFGDEPSVQVMDGTRELVENKDYVTLLSEKAPQTRIRSPYCSWQE